MRKSSTIHYKGKTVYPTAAKVNIRLLTSKGKNIGFPTVENDILATVSRPEALGVCTGVQFVPTSKQGNQNGWLEVRTKFGLGYVRFDLLTLTKPIVEIKAGDGEQLIKYIAAKDRSTFNRLIYCKELINAAKKKGRKIEREERMLAEILASYERRQAKIRANSSIRFTQKVDQAFTGIWNRVKDTFGISGAIGDGGAISIPVVLGIVALVAISTAIIVWQQFQTDGKAAEIDLNKAAELARLLETVEPETKKKVLKEIQEYGQGNYEDGFGEGKAEGGASFFDKAGNILLAAGAGIVAVTILTNSKNDKGRVRK